MSNDEFAFEVDGLARDSAVDSLSKVPGEVRFTIDLRCQETSVLLPLNQLLDRYAEEIGTRRNVRFELGRRAVAEPTAMGPTFRSVLRNQAALLGIEAPEMPCGAGHDAAEFVRANIPSCMIFVRNTGESHNPDEDMELADFRNGVLLLTFFLAEMLGK